MRVCIHVQHTFVERQEYIHAYTGTNAIQATESNVIDAYSDTKDMRSSHISNECNDVKVNHRFWRNSCYYTDDYW